MVSTTQTTEACTYALWLKAPDYTRLLDRTYRNGARMAQPYIKLKQHLETARLHHLSALHLPPRHFAAI